VGLRASNGEALAYLLAFERHPVSGFESAFAWLDSLVDPDPARRHPDFVDTSDDVDSNLVSYGCGPLFINWLRFQLGFRLAEIVPAGGSTLVETCRRPSGWTDAFVQFITVVNLRIASAPSNLLRDNAFPFGPERDGMLLQGRKADPVSVIFGQASSRFPTAPPRHDCSPMGLSSRSTRPSWQVRSA
jgi:hypothetical protein